tara:strand:+ start:2701 stop:4602 length:1902 start_codon:yes stop_codon:yes gene_type:complete
MHTVSTFVTVTHRFKAAVFAVVLAAGLLAVPAAPPALADNTAKCGAKGEKPCPIGKKASFVAKAQTKCPRGSFFDVASFACWSCPAGFSKTGAPAKTGQACLKKPSTEYSDADKDGKIKFSKKTIRRIKNGKFDKICKGNSYYDKKGGKYGACWECPKGFVRNIAKSVKGDRACVKVSGLSRKSATRVSGFNPCRKGFFDPRAGGQCWSCPAGYFRGPTKVNSRDACLIKATNVCDKGNILVYSRCQKRNECGRLGQRPCLVVERIPSCKAGLLEDFSQNKCVNATALLCGVFVDTVKAAQKGSKALGKKQKQAQKKIIKVTETAFKTVMGKKAYNSLVKSVSGGQKLIRKAQKTAGKTVANTTEKFFRPLVPITSDIGALAAGLDRGKNKLADLMTSRKFCLQSPNQKMKSIEAALGVSLKPPQGKRASLRPGLFDGLLIKSAHAADDELKNTLAYGISVSFTDIPEPYKTLLTPGGKAGGKGDGMINPGIGFSVSYYGVTDGRKNAQRMGIGFVATTAKAVFDMTPFISILYADRVQDVGGGGFSFGMGGGIESLDQQLARAGAKVGSVTGPTSSGALSFAILTANNPLNQEGLEIGVKLKRQQNQKWEGGKRNKVEFSGEMSWGWDFALK